MKIINIQDYINSFINSAETNFKNLDDTKEKVEKNRKIIQIIGELLQSLDYTVNNFPGGIQNTKGKHVYFPRPDPREQSKKYFKRIKASYTGTQIHEFQNFINDSFKIICKYKKSISYIEASIKHKNPPSINDGLLKYTIRTFDGSQHVSYTTGNADASVKNMLESLSYGPIEMQNVTYNDKDGTLLIDDLNHIPDIIVLKNDVNLHLKDFLYNCIETCKEISDIFIRYTKKITPKFDIKNIRKSYHDSPITCIQK